jgi:dCMP deaminase
MSDRWDRHFLGLALACAKMSKDPSTIVGAVVVGPDREIRASGFNGFPRGIPDSPSWLADREIKLRVVVHAECNCICNAARVGVSLKGCTLYLAASDHSGMIWGGAPCTRCTVHVIQAGIKQVVTFPPKGVPSRWHEDIAFARKLLEEAGVGYVEIEAHPADRATPAQLAQLLALGKEPHEGAN